MQTPPILQESPMSNPLTIRPMSFTYRLAAIILAASCAVASAAAPRYHIEAIEIPGALGVYARDINDSGQIVGYYIDADGIHRAFLYDASGPHTLAVPESDTTTVDSSAAAINNAGQIAGSIQFFGERSPGALWDAADPSTFTLITGETDAIALESADINDKGVVVGLKANRVTGEAFHGFVWSQTGGIVDYGTTNTSDPSINASWSAINDAGQIVGVWNFQFAPMHASVGTLGTPVMLPMSAAADAVESGAMAINAAGVRVGYMDVDGSGNRVPVVFDADGEARAIEGATLGLPTGQALGINDAGVIVGRADDFATLSFKAFVAIDGVAYDVLEVADGNAGFPYLLTAQAVNSDGVIIGLGRVGDFDVGSYVLTPLAGDSIFADGFDP
jgi:probable HAF family extracellular repeat protein